ncbi:MAG: hypothetical protein WCY02_01015, partial [Parvibaculum sp.]
IYRQRPLRLWHRAAPANAKSLKILKILPIAKTQKARQAKCHGGLLISILVQFGCGGPQPTILAVDGTEDSKNANKI